MVYKVFNPTHWEIEVKMGNKFFIIKPFSSLVHTNFTEEPLEFFYDPNIAEFILSAGAEQGLVSLEFGKKDKALFNNNFEKYKLSQALKGLKALYMVQKEIELMQRTALQERRNAQMIVHKDEDDMVLQQARHKMGIIEKAIADLGETMKFAEKKTYDLKQEYVKPAYLIDNSKKKSEDNK